MSSRSKACRKFITRKPHLHDPVTRIEHAEKFFAALGAPIRHGGNRAFYSIAADVIRMPKCKVDGGIPSLTAQRKEKHDLIAPSFHSQNSDTLQDSVTPLSVSSPCFQ
jgi:antirestriction protein ArdC